MIKYQEKWIEDYEGLYKITIFGSVISFYGSRGEKKQTLKYQMTNGYTSVHLYLNRARKSFKIHRLIAGAFILNPENKPCINHKDGIKTNNDIGNLEWVTYSENTQHAFAIGLIKSNFLGVDRKGSKNSMSRLTKQDILDIRDSTESIKYLMGKYSIKSCGHMSDIINRKKWSHI